MSEEKPKEEVVITPEVQAFIDRLASVLREDFKYDKKIRDIIGTYRTEYITKEDEDENN